MHPCKVIPVTHIMHGNQQTHTNISLFIGYTVISSITTEPLVEEVWTPLLEQAAGRGHQPSAEESEQLRGGAVWGGRMYVHLIIFNRGRSPPNQEGNSVADNNHVLTWSHSNRHTSITMTVSCKHCLDNYQYTEPCTIICRQNLVPQHLLYLNLCI